MSQLTTFLTQNGIPEQAILWLFLLPVAITVVVVARQIVGVKGFGISLPILIGYAFVATGIQAGVIIFLAALGTGFLVRAALSHIRLLYLPKMAIILAGVTVALVILTPFLPYEEGLEFPQAAFSLLIFIIAVEQFASFLIERGLRKTFGLSIETLAVSTAIFFLINWGWLRNTVLSYPLFILGTVLIFNFILGKWTGLRFSEYVRFKDVIFK